MTTWSSSGGAASRTRCFVGGRVFRATGGPPVAQGVAVAGGRVVAVADDDDVRALAGPSTDVVDLAGGLLTPGFQDAHVHPVHAGALMLQCDLQDAPDAARGGRRVRPGPPGARVGDRWRLVDGGLPRRPSPPVGARRRGPGPPRAPHQPGRPRRLGEHRRAAPGRHRPRHRRPRRRPPGARRRRRADRPAARGRRDDGRPAAASHDRAGPAGRAPRCAVVPAVARHHRLAGRDRRPVPRPARRAADLPRGGRGGRARGPGRRGPVVGPRRGASSSCRSCASAARAPLQAASARPP